MRHLIKYSIEHKIVTYFICFLIVLGGVASFHSLNRLEDPEFSVKTALVTTTYPGASPVEVEKQVTENLEKEIMRMPEVKNLYSISRAGLSLIRVDIKDKYWSKDLPQVWDNLRKKVDDVKQKLPEGVNDPVVGDDFGFVYGFLIALVGDGYTQKEIETFAKRIQKELTVVENVSRVDLWGVQPKAIYLEVSESEIANYKMSAETLSSTLYKQNRMVNAGFVDDPFNRIRIEPTGEFTSPKEIGELIIRPNPNDILGLISNFVEKQKVSISLLKSKLQEISDNTLQVKDIAKIKEGYQDPPTTLMRYNGYPSIGIQIAASSDSNVVLVGQALDKKIAEIQKTLPIGIEIFKISWQSDLISESISNFVVSFIEAVVIVLVVLLIPSGLRMGLLIGASLVLTIFATFIYLGISNTPLQRLSLGALIIAMGMMVDNAIVISDLIAIKIRQGQKRIQAAVEGALNPSFPLLGATIIAIMAFFPIFISPDSTGEYCRTLFTVVATALLLSWIIAVTVVPLLCVDFLPQKTSTKTKKKEKDEFDTPLFNLFRKILRNVISYRYLTLSAMVLLLVVSIFSFNFVQKLFFPDSTRPQLMIDYWAPAGTRIQTLSNKMKTFEKHVMKDPRIESISSFIGSGPPRFYLPVDSEYPYPNYGQFILNFHSYQDINPFIDTIRGWIKDNFPEDMIRIRKYTVGPGTPWPFELRLLADPNADLKTLNKIATQIKTISQNSPYSGEFRLDSQNPTLKILADYDQPTARLTSVTRPDLARAFKRSYDGVIVGSYREGDDIYPIILRNINNERKKLLDHLDNIQIKPTNSIYSLPASQVLKSINLDWEFPFVMHWNQKRQVAIQGGPTQGKIFTELYDDVIEKINQVKLPQGYEIYWDGELRNTQEAQQYLLPGIIPSAIIILLFLVIIFNAFRPVLIILLTIPFAIVGITFALLLFNVPFGFVALLGAMSLVGMMNKNIVVLIDACNENLANGMDPYNAIVESAVTRVRPVLLAAGTTVLGVIPLLQDVFWQGLCVAIIGGLSFGSLLTLFAVPVFYSILYKVEVPTEKEKK